MREPPGDPNTRNSRPAGSSTIAGVIPDSIRFPGAMAFASPWTRPNRFGLPGAVMKSSISSFSRNPAPRGRRHRVDGVAAVADRDRIAPLDPIAGEVVSGDEPAAAGHLLDDQLRDAPVIEHL